MPEILTLKGPAWFHNGKVLSFMIGPSDHAGWVRLFGRGVGIVDHRKFRPLFSERYSGQHGVPKRHFLHVGPFCLRTLRPL